MSRPSPLPIRFVHGHAGVRLACNVAGEGITVIKAATWLSHLEADTESPVWRHVIEAFAQRCRLVRYDERGCGLSDREVADLGFDSWVHDLEAIADAEGGERFALLGISQGASIAIAYAVRHPERVSHLILQGGYARGRLVRSRTPEQVEEAEMMCRLAELGWGRDDPAFRQFFTSQFIPGGTAEQHAWFNELQRISTSPANAARFMRAFNTIDVTPLLRQVRCPTLVLHSRDDRRVPYEEGRLLATEIPGARFVTLDSSNHLLLDDASWQTAWQAIVDTLPVPAALPVTEFDGVLATLTPRLRELLDLVAQGRDNAQIAATLGLSEKTVRNQVSLLLDRLGVESRAMAIVTGREAGFGRTTH